MPGHQTVMFQLLQPGQEGEWGTMRGPQLSWAKMPEPPEQETACKPLPLVAAPEDFYVILSSACLL